MEDAFDVGGGFGIDLDDATAILANVAVAIGSFADTPAFLELKRRTRVATLFPNEAALLRLVTAILVEVSEEWETGKRYVTFETK